MYVPLATFAVDLGGVCELYIQNIGSDNSQPLVLGTMFIQQFRLYVETNFNSNTSAASIMVSETFSMPNTYIGSDVASSSVSPFNFTINPIVLNVTITNELEELVPIINADFDFQGINQYQIGLTSD